jgi:hypothetical protein
VLLDILERTGRGFTSPSSIHLKIQYLNLTTLDDDTFPAFLLAHSEPFYKQGPVVSHNLNLLKQQLSYYNKTSVQIRFPYSGLGHVIIALSPNRQSHLFALQTYVASVALDLWFVRRTCLQFILLLTSTSSFWRFTPIAAGMILSCFKSQVLFELLEPPRFNPPFSSLVLSPSGDSHP